MASSALPRLDAGFVDLLPSLPPLNHTHVLRSSRGLEPFLCGQAGSRQRGEAQPNTPAQVIPSPPGASAARCSRLPAFSCCPHQ